MDILISSNLERFLYEISGRDAELISTLMEQLRKEGKYELNQDMKEKLKVLYGNFATEEETISAVRKVYEASDYVIDTHTAVAYDVFEKYRKNTGDNAVTVIASTASPFKFPGSINEALSFADKDTSDFEMIKALSDKLGLKIPIGIEGLDKKEILHRTTCKKMK